MLYIAVDQPPSRAATVKRFFEAIQAGDYATLEEVLLPDAVTIWPQSGEQVTGAMSCIRIYQNYPGGPPAYRVQRVIGHGDVWVAELVAEYDAERWYVASICEFDGDRIARLTDYFGPSLPGPEWRSQLVDPAA
jgi:hypothetical protein